MSELTNVLQAIKDATTSGQQAVFCVVLQKQGSAPRAPGAAMVVLSDGACVGTVGGGAVEAIAEQKARAMQPGDRSRVLALSLDDPHGQDDASICGGSVSIGLVPLQEMEDYAPFVDALATIERRLPAHLPVVIESAEPPVRYILHVEPPPTLVVVGAGHVGQALARVAVPLDFRVVVVDDREALVSPERFDDSVERIAGPIADTLRDYPLDPSCYVAIMTRGHRHDQAALEAVVDRPTAYIGMMASQRKAHAILGAMRNAGVAPDAVDRVHTPIGVAIGAMSVNEIAVSIAAELIKVRRSSVPKTVEGPLPVDRKAAD